MEFFVEKPLHLYFRSWVFWKAVQRRRCTKFYAEICSQYHKVHAKWLTVHICIFYFVFFLQKVPLSQHNTVHIFETKNTGLLHAVNLHSAYVLTHFVAWEAIICDACVHCTSFKASFGWIDEFKSTQKSKRFFWKELINESLILITSMTSHQISRLYYKKVAKRIAKLDNWFHGIKLLVHHIQMPNGKMNWFGDRSVDSPCIMPIIVPDDFANQYGWYFGIVNIYAISNSWLNRWNERHSRWLVNLGLFRFWELQLFKHKEFK